MRVALLSDLHIGPDPGSDGFRHEEAAFRPFLEGLIEEHDRVVLLGDVWQCDHGPWPGHAAALRELERARERAPWLEELLAREELLLVHGNHDFASKEQLQAPEWLLLEGLLAIHGHQADPLLVKGRLVSAAATWFSGRLRALGLRGLARWAEDRDVAIKAERFQTPEGPYAHLADALAAEHGARWVVMGHTHVQTRMALAGGGELLNCGTCSFGRFEWVSVDTASGQAALHSRR